MIHFCLIWPKKLEQVKKNIAAGQVQKSEYIADDNSFV